MESFRSAVLCDCLTPAFLDDTTTITSTTPPPVAHAKGLDLCRNGQAKWCCFAKILKSSTLQFALLEEGGADKGGDT